MEILTGLNCKTYGIADILYSSYNFIIITLAASGWFAGDRRTKGTPVLVGSLHSHARDDRPGVLSVTHNTYIIICNVYLYTRRVEYF